MYAVAHATGDAGCAVDGSCVADDDPDDLKVMWTTPIQKTTLKLGSANEALKETILSAFEQYATVAGDDLAEGPNELFFQDQQRMHDLAKPSATMNVHLRALRSSPEIMRLKTEIKQASARYLEACGRQDASQLVHSSDLFSWASVHRHGSSHLPHIHQGALVSGVYYVAVGSGSGNIVFEDPRGPLPPFDNRVIHTPRSGQLLLFPPWLVHHVTPTTGTKERISISFNIGGEWSATSDVSLTFPAPE
jgi:uncharacterized protein (TIGR02466 family)